MSEFTRPRHRLVLAALQKLDAKFLASAACFFGGGTRIALDLNEYRESADVDFLCASREGYRRLRSTVNSASLGRIVRQPVALAREVIADRYGIRTFMAAAWGGEPLASGLAAATQAYGKVVTRDAKRAATAMLEDAQWRRRCVDGLAISDRRTLLKGLRVLVKNI